MKDKITDIILLIATLTFLMVILRLANIIMIPWWVVLTPVWLPGASLIVLLAILYFQHKLSHRNERY